MSCWVAVTVAGEYLSLSPGEVMKRIESGELESRVELGMLMVDVKPECGPLERRRQPRPMKLPLPSERAQREDEIERVIEQIDSPDHVEHDRFTDWRNARAKTARARKAPLAA